MINIKQMVFPAAIYIAAIIVLCPAYKTDAQQGNNKSEKLLYSECLTAVDHFGRSFNVVSSYNQNKKVGMFFWLWIGQPYATGIYDATKISKMPNGNNKLYNFDFQNDSISPNLQAHYWGEPLWGYYNSDDEWVIRRQIQMLTAAGIDFIVFDATNSVTYPEVYQKVLKVISEYAGAGFSPPKAAFYTHSRSVKTTLKLYDELYSKNIYPDSWYRVEEKPFIIAYTSVEDDIAEALTRQDTSYKPEPLTSEILDYFTFSKPQWPFDPVYQDGFPWIEWQYPQPLHNNMINVTVASHPNVPMSKTITQGVENWGRGWDPINKKNISGDVDNGTFFQKQWDHAIEVNPELVFVGGWNEWIAIKQPWGGEYMLCDAASKEFSRDIEPMQGGYKDAFYIQLIMNVRKFKGVSGNIPNGCYKQIKMSDGLKQWESVEYAFINTDNKMISRNSYGGAKTVTYTQAAPVNRLQKIKVCHDDENIYFLVQSENEITLDNNSSNSMNIFISPGEAELKGWEGYEYVAGRSGKDSMRSVERLNKDYSGKASGEAEYLVAGNIMQVKIPRKAVGLDNGHVKFYFKIADNVSMPDDIMDYYISGISMPLGRLSFTYKF